VAPEMRLAPAAAVVAIRKSRLSMADGLRRVFGSKTDNRHLWR